MNVFEFNYDSLSKLPTVEKKTRKTEKENEIPRKPYINEFLAFDIETTNLDDIEQAVMYLFAIQIGDDTTLYGRTWEEFKFFIDNARKAVEGKKLVIYVHNLSFEFSFLSGLYDFTDAEVFATDAHKVIRCTMYDTIEFRCSYFLTNLGLAAFTKQMQVENEKLSGEEFDYSKQRFPWSKLSDFEMQYMTNDVKGLVQALKKKFEMTHDDIATIPLTSTGFVRRDVREAMKTYSRSNIARMFPDEKIYNMLRDAYRGGNTMANRYVADQIIENVSSFDMVSSYPNVLLTEKYPMSKFKIDFNRTIKHLRKIKDAFIVKIGFGDIQLKDPNCPCPYLSLSKCRYVDNRDVKKVKIWNGRILKADFLETTLTDIDFRIVDQLYTFKSWYIEELYTAKYDKLPQQLRDVILHYYSEKTILKGTKYGDPDYVYYCMLKALLNAVYGMMVEDPCKNEVIFGDENFEKVKIDSISERLESIKYKSCLVYQWGVWCSAHARKNLQDGIDLVGDDFVYCDTDSVKFTGKHDFSLLNRRAEYKAQNAGAFAKDRTGKTHYIGVWEEESDDYPKPNRFSTLGAKKYVVEVPDPESKTGVSLHITISGVGKKGGEELGKIENFKEGFTFYDYGKSISKYNTHINQTIEREGHELQIIDNCYIRGGTYTLGLAAENRAILEGLVKIAYSDIDLEGLYTHAATED